MIRRAGLHLGGVLGACLVLQGCVSLDAYQQLKRENEMLQRGLEETKSSMSRSVQEIHQKNAELAAKTTAREREVGLLSEELQRSRQALVGLGGRLDQAFGGSREWVEWGPNWVSFKGDFLFDSGQSTLKAQATDGLAKLAAIVKEKGYFLRIEGHTDTDPIKHTAQLWKDNFHLSVVRALEVCWFLKSQGVSANKLHVVGWGEYRPVDPANKARNRRVEIVFSTAPPEPIGQKAGSKG